MPAPTMELPAPLDRKLRAIAEGMHGTRAGVLREGLDAFAKQATRPAVAPLARDLIGSLEGPEDLATNPKYMSGYDR